MLTSLAFNASSGKDNLGFVKAANIVFSGFAFDGSSIGTGQILSVLSYYAGNLPQNFEVNNCDFSNISSTNTRGGAAIISCNTNTITSFSTFMGLSASKGAAYFETCFLSNIPPSVAQLPTND